MDSMNFNFGVVLGSDRVGSVFTNTYLNILLLYDLKGNLVKVQGDELWS
jgi:hypothetical protein